MIGLRKKTQNSYKPLTGQYLVNEITLNKTMIIFSDHAKERNLLRKIPKDRIIKTVENPDEIVKSVKNRKICRKKFGRKKLEVVTVKENKKTIIITQYYLGE